MYDANRCTEGLRLCGLESFEKILAEVGFPRRFIEWSMLDVTTVSYQFNINGSISRSMKVEKGLRQGDSISHLLFMEVMEYMHRKLYELKLIPIFNFHSKCEKIGLIDMSFPDDFLFFSRGDEISLQVLMEKFQEFSKSIGLVVNPAKCKIFCGGMDRA